MHKSKQLGYKTGNSKLRFLPAWDKSSTSKSDPPPPPCVCPLINICLCAHLCHLITTVCRNDEVRVTREIQTRVVLVELCVDDVWLRYHTQDSTEETPDLSTDIDPTLASDLSTAPFNPILVPVLATLVGILSIAITVVSIVTLRILKSKKTTNSHKTMYVALIWHAKF